VVSYYNPPEEDKYLGIERLKIMLCPKNKSEVTLKMLFKKFMTWFLKNGGYMKYMLTEGKMKDKKKYIREKT